MMGPFLEIKTNVTTEATVNGHNAQDVINEAVRIAHQGLIDMSIYRQENGIGCGDEWDLSDLELDLMEFLDMVGD